MTKDERNLLLRQAMKLTTLGARVERERKQLRRLVERGSPYTDPKMLAVLERFEQVNIEWKRLESQHLALKRKLEEHNF